MAGKNASFDAAIEQTLNRITSEERASQRLDDETAKDKLFSLMDDNGDGTIDRAEFEKLFFAMKAHVVEEHRVENVLSLKADKANRRVRVVSCIGFVLLGFLCLSVGLNCLVVFALLEATKETVVGSGNVLTVAGSTDPVTVASSDFTTNGSALVTRSGEPVQVQEARYIESGLSDGAIVSRLLSNPIDRRNFNGMTLAQGDDVDVTFAVTAHDMAVIRLDRSGGAPVATANTSGYEQHVRLALFHTTHPRFPGLAAIEVTDFTSDATGRELRLINGTEIDQYGCVAARAGECTTADWASLLPVGHGRRLSHIASHAYNGGGGIGSSTFSVSLPAQAQYGISQAGLIGFTFRLFANGRGTAQGAAPWPVRQTGDIATMFQYRQNMIAFLAAGGTLPGTSGRRRLSEAALPTAPAQTTMYTGVMSWMIDIGYVADDGAEAGLVWCDCWTHAWDLDGTATDPTDPDYVLDPEWDARYDDCPPEGTATAADTCSAGAVTAPPAGSTGIPTGDGMEQFLAWWSADGSAANSASADATLETSTAELTAARSLVDAPERPKSHDSRAIKELYQQYEERHGRHLSAALREAPESEHLQPYRRQLFLACPTTGRRICHPPHSTVELASGAHVRLDAVAVGDAIRTPSGFEPVVGFLHADAHAPSTYHVFTTEANQTIAISDKHYLFVDGVEADPATVELGQVLSTATGPQAVVAIAKEAHVGAYHPMTASGAYYVDGIAASTYPAYIPHNAWKVVGDGYVSLRYQLGLPVVPEGAAPVSLFWLLDALTAVGVPEAVQSAAFWPLIAGSVMLTELGSAVVAATPAAFWPCSSLLTAVASVAAPMAVRAASPK